MPHTVAVSQQIFGKSIVPDMTDEYIAIALLLMHEKLKGADSLWKPYFDILPSKEDVYPSFVWTEDELNMLKGSPTYFASKSLRCPTMSVRMPDSNNSSIPSYS